MKKFLIAALIFFLMTFVLMAFSYYMACGCAPVGQNGNVRTPMAADSIKQ